MSAMKKTAKVPPPDMHGNLEGKFAISVPEMIAKLNKVLAMEYNSWLTYVHFSQMVRGPNREQLAEIFKEHAGEELKHVDALSLRIVALGGITTTKTGEVPTTLKVEDMILILVRQEQEALKAYRDILRLVGQNEGLRQVIETIIEDEQEHADELWLLIPGGPVSVMEVVTSQLEKIGTKYHITDEVVPKLAKFLDDLETAIEASADDDALDANVSNSPYLVRVMHDDGVKTLFEVAKFEDRKEPNSTCHVLRVKKSGAAAWKCDCQGAKQWGKCKHIPMVQKWDKGGRKLHPAFSSVGLSFKSLMDTLRKQTENPLEHSHRTHPKRKNVNPTIKSPKVMSKPDLKTHKKEVHGPVKTVKQQFFRLKKS